LSIIQPAGAGQQMLDFHQSIQADDLDLLGWVLELSQLAGDHVEVGSAK
jgi:hypothetical protein